MPRRHTRTFSLATVALSLTLAGPCGACAAGQAGSQPDGSERGAEGQPGAGEMASARSYARSLSRAFNSVADELAPSVVFVQRRDVRIVGARRDFFGRTVRPGREELFDSGNGSGVIVAEDGLILTNNHVIEGAESLEVQLTDGRVYAAEVLGADPATDIAVLKIDATGLAAATLGDSDALQVGDWVLAMGSPFGLSNTVTAGIVSAKGREGVLSRSRQRSNAVQYEEFIQTDAAINPGNSGGPLVSLDGDVIGINTAIFSRSGGNIGLSFAVPTSIAERVMRTIIENGRVARGWLGVTLEDISADDAAFMGIDDRPAAGVLVTGVTPDSPAAEAGIEEGDVILAADGRPAEEVSRLINTIALSGPDREIELITLRDGRERRIRATLAEREAYIRRVLGVVDVPELGVAIVSLSARAAQTGAGDQDAAGLFVYDIDESGVAARSGLREEDVILRVDGRDATDADDLQRGLRTLDRSGELELFVVRGARRGTVTLRTID
ncbi:MAG: trypsin-like peptidase domain-containing protein [Planctomycetota bacterium]